MNPVIAVDPGVSGAVVLYVPDAHTIHAFRDFKTVSELSNAIRIAAGLLSGADGQRLHGVVELVSSRPGQGVVSTFSFGKATGAALGAMTALGIQGRGAEIDQPHPLKWQNWVKKTIGRRPLADQKASEVIYAPRFSEFDSRIYALNVFPEETKLFARAKDHNTADAVLIAVYQAWHDRELPLQRFLVDQWAYLAGHRDTRPVPPSSYGDTPSDRDTPRKPRPAATFLKAVRASVPRETQS